MHNKVLQMGIILKEVGFFLMIVYCFLLENAEWGTTKKLE